MTIKYTAVIVEPRQHNALEYVLLNFTENLGTDWEFIIFHGTHNIDFLNDILNKNQEKWKDFSIRLINLGVSNLSTREYSELFYSIHFYDNIYTEMFLVFQTDTFISRKNKHKIYDFLNYDYVGAPWFNIFNNLDKRHAVGNGGLSFRRKSKMMEMISKYMEQFKNSNDRHLYFEDRFFSNTCETYFEGLELNKPDYTIASDFCTETLFISENCFGVHKPWDYLYMNNHIFILYDTIDGLEKLSTLQNWN